MSQRRLMSKRSWISARWVRFSISDTRKSLKSRSGWSLFVQPRHDLQPFVMRSVTHALQYSCFSQHGAVMTPVLWLSTVLHLLLPRNWHSFVTYFVTCSVLCLHRLHWLSTTKRPSRSPKNVASASSLNTSTLRHIEFLTMWSICAYVVSLWTLMTKPLTH